MGEKKGLGLASKLNILMIGLLLMASAGISCSVIKIHKAGSYAELLRNGMRIAAMVSLSSEYAIYTEDRKALENIAENFQGEDIAYLALLNKDKRPLIEKSFQESGKVPDGNRTRVSLGQSMHMDLVDNSGKPYVEFFSPVMASAGASTVLFQELGTSTEQMQVIGYVQLGLTLDGLQEQSRSFLLSIILITATVIVVGVLITLMLTRRITLPIRRLAAATQDISEGRIDQVIQVNSHDEICELARSFNLMLRRLREYREEVEQQ
ncbi:MAG: HAMP domain-containing protein, partial [Syntrophobacteraceae bacterium]